MPPGGGRTYEQQVQDAFERAGGRPSGDTSPEAVARDRAVDGAFHGSVFGPPGSPVRSMLSPLYRAGVGAYNAAKRLGPVTNTALEIAGVPRQGSAASQLYVDETTSPYDPTGATTDAAVSGWDGTVDFNSPEFRPAAMAVPTGGGAIGNVLKPTFEGGPRPRPAGSPDAAGLDDVVSDLPGGGWNPPPARPRPGGDPTVQVITGSRPMNDQIAMDLPTSRTGFDTLLPSDAPIEGPPPSIHIDYNQPVRFRPPANTSPNPSVATGAQVATSPSLQIGGQEGGYQYQHGQQATHGGRAMPAGPSVGPPRATPAPAPIVPPAVPGRVAPGGQGVPKVGSQPRTIPAGPVPPIKPPGTPPPGETDRYGHPTVKPPVALGASVGASAPAGAQAPMGYSHPRMNRFVDLE